MTDVEKSSYTIDDELYQLQLDCSVRGFTSVATSIAGVLNLLHRDVPPLNPQELGLSFQLWFQSAQPERAMSRIMSMSSDDQTWMDDNAFYGSVCLRVSRILKLELQTMGVQFQEVDI